MDKLELDGWFADFERQNFFFGRLNVDDGKISSIRETGEKRLNWNDAGLVGPFILPGLVDSHVHIESSMLLPSRFAMQAVRFGTVATVSDPHEIANVMGLEGILLMMEDARKSCLKIHFTAPSCVPATSLESAGARLEVAQLEPLFSGGRVVALGEMMNYPGVIAGDQGVLDKISLARRFGKPVDGHAPGLTGKELEAYVGAGIHTDHECSTLEEAEEKIKAGMMILIREGSSARNFENLYPLIDKYPDRVMLCTDDYHPDDLMKGHIDRLVRRGLKSGLNFFNLYRAASLNPVLHYRLSSGMLRPGDPADFIVASRVGGFRVLATYVNGDAVFSDGRVTAALPAAVTKNAFGAKPVVPADLEIRGRSGLYRVIQVFDGELVTGSETTQLSDRYGVVQPDVQRDILKIVVVNRYRAVKPSVAWITGFGLTSGALASSIAHDSHNVIGVGCSDREIAEAINLVIAHKGGIAVTAKGVQEILPLPVAGLMSTGEAAETGARYGELSKLAKGLGSGLQAPFMALSFMSLLVIPHLKIGDRGLFNCDTFEFTDLKVE